MYQVLYINYLTQLINKPSVLREGEATKTIQLRERERD